MKFHFFFLALLLVSLTTYQLTGPRSVLADEASVNVTTNQNVIVANTPLPQTLVMTDDRDTVKPGEVLTYRIVIRNTQENDLSQVKIVAHVPDYLIPQATAPEAQADPTTRTITWSSQTLSAKSEITYAIKAQVTNPAPAGNTLRARVDINGPGLRASASDTTTIEGVEGATTTSSSSSEQKVEVVDQGARDTATAITPTAPTGPATNIWVLLTTVSTAIAGLIAASRMLYRKLVY